MKSVHTLLVPTCGPQKKDLAVLNSSLIFSIFEALTKRLRRLMVLIFASRSGSAQDDASQRVTTKNPDFHKASETNHTGDVASSLTRLAATNNRNEIMMAEHFSGICEK
jgi:hypothetical protein